MANTPNHSTDTLFTQANAPSPFEFNDQVADVFENMLQRSIPGYHLLLDMITLVTQKYAQKDTQAYDLGCSLGTATLRLAQNMPNNGHVLGVDNSAAMIKRCTEHLAQYPRLAPHSVLQQDISQIAIENASIVLLNFTLQFIDRAKRQTLLNTIYQGLQPKGVLVLAEKMCFEDTATQQLQTELYHDFKKIQGYSRMEIAKKRAALENVLIPDTLAIHKQRLYQAGFTQVSVCIQCFGFFTLLAFKH